MEFPLPPVGLPSAFLPYAVVAFAMIAITVFVLGKVLPADHHAPLVTQMLLALAVLGGGMVLLLSLVFVFVNPDGTSAWTWVLLGFNFMMMAPAGIWFIGLIVFHDRRIDTSGWTWPIALGAVITGSEALMGFLFALGSPASPPPWIQATADGLASIWFFWSMAGVMVALVAWAPLSRVERACLVALTLATVLAPWVTTFPTIGGAAMAALMSVVFGLLVTYLLRHSVSRAELHLLFALAGAFLAMAFAGLFLVSDGGGIPSTIAFGAVMAVVMVVEITYLIQRFYTGPPDRPWILRPVEADEPADPAPAAVARPAPEPRSADGAAAPD